MTGAERVPAEEAGIEQGWSHGRGRQLSRFLARNLPGARRPLRGGSTVASITFDDVPENAATLGAPVLERRGLRGTFYVAADLCGQQDRYWRLAGRDHVRALAEAGHEIGCHTARHVNVQSLRGPELTRECDRSRDLLLDICGREPRNFCYPFGDLGLSQKRLLGTRFETCRTIYERLNAGRVDPALLGAYALFEVLIDRARFAALVRRAAAQGGWLILYTHDVSERPSRMGVTPRLLDEALTVLAGHGVPVLTVAQAARHHGLLASA